MFSHPFSRFLPSSMFKVNSRLYFLKFTLAKFPVIFLFFEFFFQFNMYYFHVFLFKKVLTFAIFPRRLLNETSKAIVQAVLHNYMAPPETDEQWKIIAQDCGDLWQLPHVVGAIDEKNVITEALDKSGNVYHNYKRTFNIVLLAICDAKYNFTHSLSMSVSMALI